MDPKSWILTILVISALPALSIYAWQTTPFFNEQTAIQSATQFVSDGPTFSWDGIDGSIQVINSYKTQTPEPIWVVIVEFTCANAGYGDRTNQGVAEVITDHVIEVTIKDNKVIEAKIDDTWDELHENEVIIDDTTPEGAKKMAIEFVKNAPTFSFDGIDGSIKVLDFVAAESYPVQYFITISFQCRHAGYGDRTGQMLAQVITDHEIRISISDEVVRSAIIDDEWDELLQEPVKASYILMPEQAKDLAIDYVKEKFHELSDVPVPEMWSVSHTTPEGLVGATTLEYSGGGWTIEIKHAVIQKPIYDIVLEYHNGISFTWEGQVDQEGKVSETH
jgi:hypothetical protein